MADIKFSCPNCAQHITCDELWGGHQLECPTCKASLTVPAAPAPAAGAPASLVPKVPTHAEPRLAINAAHAASTAQQPQRTVPIRNLAPAAPKKRSPVATYATVALVLIALGAGGYFGYGYLNKAQEKVSTANKSSDGGEAGHIGKLYGALDATDPNRLQQEAGSSSRGRTRRTSGVGQQIPVPAGTDSGAAAPAAPDTEPLIPAVWTMDLGEARIPSGRANGSISGTNFVPDTARIDPVGSAQVLRLLQGQPMSPDREVLVYLHLKPGEKLGGQSLSISKEMAGVGVPQVTKRWKTNPKSGPYYKSFTSGYVMKLDLGQAADGAVPGKIFLALPDVNQSVVAGNFKAVINTNVAVEATTTAVQAAPVMAPRNSRTSDAAWQARYGTRRAQ